MKFSLLSSERGYLLGATVLLLLLFIRLYSNRQPALDQAERDYAAGTKLNLQPGMKADALQRLFRQGNYLTDARDSRLIADSLPAKLRREGPPDNVGTRRWWGRVVCN